MNVAAVHAVLTHSRSANAARMVFIVLAARSNDRGLIINLSIPDICKEANASERTVKYAIEELRDELKEILTERNGTGRGSTFDFDLSPLLGRADGGRVQELHASDKRAEVAPIPLEEPAQPMKGANSAPIASEKGANIDRKGAESAPLSDSKGANFTGTEVAPSEDIRTSTDTPSPSAQEGDADAPPPPPKKVKKSSTPKPEGPMSKLSDPERAVLDAWRELTKAYPPEYAWPTIFERILDGFDAARFKRCGGAYLTHIGRGQRYVGGVLDWYQRNQTEPEERNGNGKVATGQFGKPEVTRDFSKWPRRAG